MAGGGPISQMQSNLGGAGGQQQPSMPSFATPGQQSQSPTASPQVEAPISHFGDMQYRPQQQPDSSMVGAVQQYPTYRPQQQPQPPQQSLSFDQWKQQPRIQDQAARTPEQQLQRDQQDYQQYLSGTRGMQSPPPMQNPFQQQQPSNMRTMGQIFGFGGGQQQQYGGFPGFFGGGQQPGLVTDAEDRAQMSRSQTGRQQPMQNPFQPQQPSFMQDPEYQGYQTQIGDLQRQMQEYMQKAPMYQQMRDLESKMIPFQQRYQQQQMQAMQQRQFQQPSPFRRGQFQQPMGLMGLMGGRGGMQQPRMSMDMPYARGFASELPTYFMKKGGKV